MFCIILWDVFQMETGGESAWHRASWYGIYVSYNYVVNDTMKT